MPGISLVVNNSSLSQGDFKAACEEMFLLLQDLTPEDTGFCRDSWELQFGATKCSFVNPCEYASYLDNGWSSQAPNGMIKPALEKLPEIIQGYR